MHLEHTANQQLLVMQVDLPLYRSFLHNNIVATGNTDCLKEVSLTSIKNHYRLAWIENYTRP